MAIPLARGGFSQALLVSAAREWAFLRASPWDLALATWLPLLCLVILAYELSSGVARGIPIAVVDDDHSATSRALTRALGAAPAIRVVAMPANREAAWELTRSRAVYGVVYIPAHAGRRIARGGSATMFAYYNASYRAAGQAVVIDVGNVVQAFGGQVAASEVARSHGIRSVRSSPVLVQTTMLFNPSRSYEHFLLALLFPAILHLALAMSVAGALGRELRDRTAGDWLAASNGLLLPAVVGKVLPYVSLFLAQGVASLVWLAAIRSDGVHGSVALLVGGQALMYLAYCSIAVLLVGRTRNMGTALSLTALYAGASLAFSGATFPVQEASSFVRTWSLLLPYTSYVKLQAQQLDMGAPWGASLRYVAALAGFILLPGALGLKLFGRAVRDPATWGER